MNLAEINTRLESLLQLVDETRQRFSNSNPLATAAGVAKIRSGGLSLIEKMYSQSSAFYKDFDLYTSDVYVKSRHVMVALTSSAGTLRAIQEEVEGGWFTTIKSIIAAEIFTDFLDMASYLLSEGYKDPAAVMIGGVLEEHLRQLCGKHAIDSTILKDGKDIPKTADRMNADLGNAEVYSKLYQKGVIGWLDLRNKAAHGRYSEYDIKQVQLMEQSVLDFITKTS